MRLSHIWLLPFLLSVGDEAEDGNESNWSMECSPILEVKTLHISSPILAAKSPFFYKVNIVILSKVFFSSFYQNLFVM